MEKYMCSPGTTQSEGPPAKPASSKPSLNFWSSTATTQAAEAEHGTIVSLKEGLLANKRASMQ